MSTATLFHRRRHHPPGRRFGRPLACLLGVCLIGLFTAPAASAATPTPDGAYMIGRTIGTSGSWTVVLSTVTVASGQTAVTVTYQNGSSAAQSLWCPSTLQPASITVNGQTYGETDSYCARNPGKTWSVPAGSKFPSWAKFNVVPDLAQPLTLNDWWGWGSVAGVQLIPFGCISGPGGACLGVPRQVPAGELSTPPEWLTSEATGACAVDLLGGDLADLWVGGLGGAIRYNEATNNLDRVWIVLTSAMPYASCVDLAGVLLGGVPILTEAPNVVQDILKHPLITTVS